MPTLVGFGIHGERGSNKFMVLKKLLRVHGFVQYICGLQAAEINSFSKYVRVQL